MDAVDRVLQRLEQSAPTLGSGRLLCVDGPSGSGKTTLAAQVAERTKAPVVPFDVVLAGWRGSFDEAAQDLLDTLFTPLAQGQPGSHRRYDWQRSTWGSPEVIDASDLLILEGVGSGSQLLAPYRSLLVWVHADPQLRRRRALSRAEDGEAFAPQWGHWAAREAEYFASHQPQLHAQLRIDSGDPDSGPGSGLLTQ